MITVEAHLLRQALLDVVDFADGYIPTVWLEGGGDAHGSTTLVARTARATAWCASRVDAVESGELTRLRITASHAKIICEQLARATGTPALLDDAHGLLVTAGRVHVSVPADPHRDPPALWPFDSPATTTSSAARPYSADLEAVARVAAHRRLRIEVYAAADGLLVEVGRDFQAMLWNSGDASVEHDVWGATWRP